MSANQQSDRKLRRRDALVAAGGTSLGIGALWGVGLFSGDPEAAAAASSSSCVLSPEVTEGPYWVDNNLTRRDVTEDRRGLPLALRLTVQNARTCGAIAAADVEIWHADASGAYSGVNGSNATWLRGHQKSNAKGVVLFDTIYPGWYRGRTPHIHLKVHVGGQVVHTGQLFFPDRISTAVFRTSPYRGHGQADTTNTSDSIYAQAGGSRARLRLVGRPSGKGYAGTANLGVAV
jgi:protocatechuate 3,4-dioxygenase beta subunit